jgi:hypothetical protein
MPRHTDIVTWAVVVPATGDAVRAAVSDAWNRLVGGDRRDLNLVEWTVRETPEHTVVVDHNPGSIDILDLALIRSLSRTFPGAHYLLHVEDDPGRIALYMRGRRHRWLERTSAELAAELSLPLPGGPSSSATADAGALFGCLVVEGCSPSEVAAVIAASEESSPVSLERGKLGCVVYPASLGAPPPRLAPVLGRGLSNGATLYTILSKPSEGRFHVSVDRGGAVVGVFDVPATAELLGIPTLAHIHGESLPARILAMFGIDSSRLGLDDASVTDPGELSPAWTEDEPTWRADEFDDLDDPDAWEEDQPTSTDL